MGILALNLSVPSELVWAESEEACFTSHERHSRLLYSPSVSPRPGMPTRPNRLPWELNNPLIF